MVVVAKVSVTSISSPITKLQFPPVLYGQYGLTSGPGSMSKAMGIDKSYYGLDLTENEIWIEDAGVKYKKSELKIGPRVGIDYAEEDALLPWRLRVKGNKWCSK